MVTERRGDPKGTLRVIESLEPAVHYRESNDLRLSPKINWRSTRAGFSKIDHECWPNPVLEPRANP